MRSSGTIRTISVLSAAALIGAGLLAGTADAKKKPKAPPPCPAYQPGEEGAEAETSVVTPAASSETPVEVTLSTDPGVGVGTGVPATEAAVSHVYQNVQVDSTGDALLFIRLEMGSTQDYDLFVNTPEGETVAQAAGFNPEPTIYNDNEHGGHTEKGAEMIDGLATPDCTGYTIDVGAYTSQGGDVTLKFWLE